jgi:hypothetical protein
VVSTYPGRLLPQPIYLIISGAQISAGAVVRRTPEHLPLLGEDGKILPGQLSSPTEDIARGFSVNLLGLFQIEDVGWRPLKEDLSKYWEEGEEGLSPQEGEAEYKEPTTWNYYWLDIQDVHGVSFTSSGKQFTCCVCHKPTLCNYWHFELHFHDANGIVVSQMSSNQKGKAARSIRPWLIERVKTSPLHPKIVLWPSLLYSSESI